MASKILQPPPLRDRSIEEELIVLYARRSAVENLIHCLEDYARCYAGQDFSNVGYHCQMDKWTGLLAS